MSKVVESSYHTVDETIAAVERLLSEGRTMNDIIIVTSNGNYSDIRNRTLVEVDRISVNGDTNMWKKFKELITDVGQEVALEHYGIDKQTALRYDNVLKAGNYVVLVEEIKEIPIRHNLENGPIELGKSSRQQTNKKTIRQSGSGVKKVSNTSNPVGEPDVYDEKEVGLLNQEIDFLSDKYSGRKEDETDSSAGFKKARQEKPVGRGGSGTRVTKNSTLPDGESAMPDFEDRQLNDHTVKEDDKRFSGKEKNNAISNGREPVENPLQGKPKEGTDYQNDDMHDTAVEDSEDLPRFSGSSITGQPVVDPLQDRE